MPFPSTIAVAVPALFLALSLWHLGRRRAGYRHVRHTISELGERGAADARRAAVVFLLVGLWFAAVWITTRATQPHAAMLAACIAVGYAGAAVFPCDPGAPLHGSWRQTLHNLCGGVQYLGGAAVMARLGARHEIFVPAAVLVAAAALALSVPALARWRGAVQRVAEAVLLIALYVALSAGAAT